MIMFLSSCSVMTFFSLGNSFHGHLTSWWYLGTNSSVTHSRRIERARARRKLDLTPRTTVKTNGWRVGKKIFISQKKPKIIQKRECLEILIRNLSFIITQDYCIYHFFLVAFALTAFTPLPAPLVLPPTELEAPLTAGNLLAPLG